MGLCGKKVLLEFDYFACVLLRSKETFEIIMVHSCRVIGCTARWEPDKNFFRISCEKEPEKRNKWLRAIRRTDPDDPRKAWIPAATERVCEAHFLYGQL